MNHQSDETEADLAKILGSDELEMPVRHIGPELFAKLADPDTLAVLEAHEAPGSAPAERIAAHLGLPTEKVEGTIELLIRDGLLVPAAEGSGYAKSADQFRAMPKEAPVANENYYDKLIQKISRANKTVFSEPKILNGLVMMVDPKRLPLAEKIIVQFTNELCDLLEQGERTHSYQLGLQLFPTQPTRRSDFDGGTPHGHSVRSLS